MRTPSWTSIKGMVILPPVLSNLSFRTISITAQNLRYHPLPPLQLWRARWKFTRWRGNTMLPMEPVSPGYLRLRMNPMTHTIYRVKTHPLQFLMLLNNYSSHHSTIFTRTANTRSSRCLLLDRTNRPCPLLHSHLLALEKLPQSLHTR
jgi:hypothetical protein